MKDVQTRDEEFVCVLLLITCQVASIYPNQEKNSKRNVRGSSTAIKLEEIETGIVSQKFRMFVHTHGVFMCA